MTPNEILTTKMLFKDTITLKTNKMIPDSGALTSVLGTDPVSADAGKIDCPKVIANLRHQIEIHFKSFTLTSSGNVSTISAWEPSNRFSNIGALVAFLS